MSTYNRSGSSRNRSSSRRRTRRGRPRYDRIVGAAAVLIVIMILFVSCCKSCGDDDSKKDETSYDTSSQEDGKNNNDESTSDDSALAGLESFSTVSEMPNAVFEGDLILVNKQHEYSFPASVKNSDNDSSEDENNSSEDNGEEQSGEMEVSGDIVPVYTEMSDSYQVCDYETSLSSDTILAINSMMDKFYEKTGHNDTMIIGGYRTKEYQDKKYNSGSSDIKGGCSEFHTGLSFDLGIFPEGENSYYYTAEGDYSWILENCANYGFILRYPEKKEDLTGMDSKSYQFRYVGIPHAIYIMQNDMCFEEYIEFLKNYTYESEHLTVAGPDKNYEIYYVPADPSANTDVPVPADKTYEISGNNVDGFIVTVEK